MVTHKPVTCTNDDCGKSFIASFTDAFGEPNDKYPCSPECALATI